ncbi:unnamed protein product [Paramecium sonneborni]|uniref:Uncharacterized protein n=1 Tax=Paramecium sonneborni TaxID=65129 RepID=A0A8S1RSM5_9CILI|nr:unnamed protein product [Paramecium sonneborni]
MQIENKESQQSQLNQISIAKKTEMGYISHIIKKEAIILLQLTVILQDSIAKIFVKSERRLIVDNVQFISDENLQYSVNNSDETTTFNSQDKIKAKKFKTMNLYQSKQNLRLIEQAERSKLLQQSHPKIAKRI